MTKKDFLIVGSAFSVVLNKLRLSDEETEKLAKQFGLEIMNFDHRLNLTLFVNSIIK